MPRVVEAPEAVRLSPSADAEQVAGLNPGDVFAVLEFAGGWAWGFVEASHRVGYVPATALSEAAGS